MNATALAALPTPLPAAGPMASTAMSAPVAGLALSAADCVAQSAELLRLACRRGQLEDASAAARVALGLAEANSPHQALLRALAEAQPTLMAAPEESRLYLLREADGRAAGLLRLRDNHQVGLQPPAGAQQWALREGNLELCDAQGRPSARFPLCGQRGALRLYLGENLADGAPRLLQEQRCTYTRLSMLDPELVDAFCGLYSVDALVPAELPAKAVLLLGMPHSGVQALAAQLNRSAALFIDGDLLHPQGVRLAEGEAPRGALLQMLRSKDPAWFVRMMLGRSHDQPGRDLSALPVRGFTLAPSHSGPTLDWALDQPTLRIVHVARSNLLAEFADLQAEAAAPGAMPGQPNGQDGRAPLPFDSPRFLRFVEMKRRHLAALRPRLMARNGDTVEVDGSRLNAATLHELMGFLTDDAAPAITLPGLQPASTAPVIQRFDNPQDVMRCLAYLGQPGWAEVEGALLDAV